MAQLRYTYTAQCPYTGALWQLPRTEEVESMAKNLMESLTATLEYPPIGNLYGVLLAQTKAGDRVALKGFSGSSAEQTHQPGWVCPLPLHAQMALAEVNILAELDRLKQQLIALEQLPARGIQSDLSQQYAVQLQQLAARQSQRKQRRDRLRIHYGNQLNGDVLIAAMQMLERESQQDSAERRRLKQAKDQALRPSSLAIDEAAQQTQALKLKYKTLSKSWQAYMQAAYFAEQDSMKCGVTEQSVTEQYVIEQGEKEGDLASFLVPAWRCQRAAAKLLYHAITHQLTPRALAEFWWGANPQGDYVSGQFYGATPEDNQILRQLCQMNMPPILKEPITPLSIVYEDEYLIVVDKPAGLLSVSGRRYYLQDSVLSRLRCQLPSCAFLQAVHRLDQETSGLLAIATSPGLHSALSQQFAQRQVLKTYEAILSRPVDRPFGTIELSLRRHLDNHPRQIVDFERGKPSRTDFRVLTFNECPKVEFVPHTGRTHQLRVHAAHPDGLNAPILGDVLYGMGGKKERLRLHATVLEFVHPITKKTLRFNSPSPF